MPHSSQLRLRMRACMRTCVCACVRACVHVCTCVESSSVVAAARFSDTYHDPLVWKHACCAHPCAHTHPVARVASDAARRQAPPRWPAPLSQTAPPAMRVCMHTCVRACMRALPCVRACIRACERACSPCHACVHAYVRASRASRRVLRSSASSDASNDRASSAYVRMPMPIHALWLCILWRR